MPSSTCHISLWDARDVLKIENMRTCIGQARSRGRDCTVAIACHNRQKANSLMDALNRRYPDPAALEADLLRLAGLLLCQRFHQNQSQEIVDKWNTYLEDLRESRSSSSETSVSTTQSTTQSTRSESSQTSSQSSSRISHTVTIPTPIIDESPVRSAEQPPTSPSAATTQGAENAASPSVACTRRHIRRRAIDDSCPICYEDFLLRDQDQLVWCKSGCGRTVHKTCFDTWKTACLDREAAVTCVMCRTQWARDCAC